MARACYDALVMFVSALLLACTPTEPVEGGTVLADWTPPVVDDTRAAAVWSASEAEARLVAVVDAPLPAPGAARDAYLALMARGDAACPGDALQLMDTHVPLDGCTAASGVRFHGISRWLAGSAVDGSNQPEAFLLYGDMRIEEPDGDTLEAGGFAGLKLASGAGRVARRGEVSGSWVQQTGREWLGEGLSGTLVMDHVVEAGVPRARVTGGVTRSSSTVYFDAPTFEADCRGQARGAVSVRDPSGGWWRYDLGDTRCDGCGTLSFEDEPATEVCVDVAPLAAAIDVALEPS